jgi:hypothetical protein
MEIPTSPFSEDDGSADPRIVQLIHSWSIGAVEMSDLVAALGGTRLLVPVVAVLDEVEAAGDSGLVQEKDSHMALPLMVRPDGQRGLLAFTSMSSLQMWQADARPIPTMGAHVAAAAIQEGAAALVIDVLGPIRVAIEADWLRQLASGTAGSALDQE